MAGGSMDQAKPLAENGPPLPDASKRTVSIPIRVINGVVVSFEGKALPALKDCIGDLVVPAFALKNSEDLDRLTEEKLWPLFKEGETLLCRLGARHIPRNLVQKCRRERVPDSAADGAFVEIVLDEPLHMRTRGTKIATLEPVKCRIPVLKGVEPQSINEAYRRISEVFEPARRSAGGNVFLNVYYFAPKRQQWRPLDEVRGGLPFLPTR
jgi:hypothetical protein